MKQILVVVVGMLLMVQGLAQAQVYRWVDEDGVTHFSDKAPKGQKADQVKIKVQSPGGTKSYHEYDPQRLKENEQRFLRAVEAERRVREQRKAELAQKQQERDAYCKRLHDNLLNYREGFAMVRRDESGVIQHVPDAEVKAKHAELESLWQERCQNPQQ